MYIKFLYGYIHFLLHISICLIELFGVLFLFSLQHTIEEMKKGSLFEKDSEYPRNSIKKLFEKNIGREIFGNIQGFNGQSDDCCRDTPPLVVTGNSAFEKQAGTEGCTG